MADRQMPANSYTVDDLWGWIDSLLAAGGRLAEQLENIQPNPAPWTAQILEEWEEATKP